MRVKQLFSLALAGSFFAACSSSTSSSTEAVSRATDSLSSLSGKAEGDSPGIKQDPKIGFYVGGFKAEQINRGDLPVMEENRINISLDSLKDGNIYGHSVVAGNLRPFTGTYTEKNGYFEVKAKEPGNDQYDGVFTFTLNPVDEKIEGRWLANNKKLAVPERSYVLYKKEFEYDPNQELDAIDAEVFNVSDTDADGHEHFTPDAAKINASTTLLKKSDVENMYRRDLELMRNAIYARHGYSFKNRVMRHFFDNEVSWYIPLSTDVSKQLTELEKTNIDLLKRYEKHAEAYYDDFGR